MFRSVIRLYLNVISYVVFLFSIMFLIFSIINFQSRVYSGKMEEIKNNEKILNEFNQRINSSKKANDNLFSFLDFLNKIDTNVYVQSIDYSPESLDATILIEVVNGLKIVSPYQIKEIGTLDLFYKQYKILEMKK
jgi:hypothetical protein